MSEPRIVDSRTALIERARYLVGEIEQIFTDCEHWNRANPTEEPMEADPGGELGHLLNRLLTTLRHEDVKLMADTARERRNDG